MKNWKTTSTGILMIIVGIMGLYYAFTAVPALSQESMTAAITGGITSILGGVGLIFAKDKNVTGGTIDNGKRPE
jgi:hypothetical protein